MDVENRLDGEDEAELNEEFEFDDLPFDFESLLVDKPDDEVICKLCYDLILKPVQLTPCGHTFCQECVQSNNFSICPYCKRPTVAQKPNRLFKSTSIDKLMMRCRFNCGSVFPLEERERHEEECELVVVKCENKCDKEGLTRKTLKDHLEECTHRREICGCGKEVMLRDLPVHLAEECEAVQDCLYCRIQLKQRELNAHNENCYKRKVEMIKSMFPHIPNVQVIEEAVAKANGNLELAIRDIRMAQNPIDTCIEVYNLTKNVRENHLQELIMQICPAVKLNFDWSFSDGTWCWINLRSEEGAQLLQSTLQARGFPFVRTPLKDNTLWLGRTDHMTFCPPLNTVDCPVHEFPTVSCPFKHNVSKNGECIRWKAGQLCEKPTMCKFAHPGKTVVDLKFTKRVPNICKFCQKGSHFGWECPERTFANGTKGAVMNDTVGGVVSTLENILISERGTMLANRAGIALRRANPATAAVLQEQFGGKLKKLLEAYPNKFALINQEQPGLAMIQLISKPTNPNGPIGGLPLPSSALTAKTPRRVPLLGRDWSMDSELLPFVHNTMQPHFEKIKNNIKTDKRLLPDLHVLVQQLHSFDRTSHVSALKSCMRSVGEAIANIQLCEYEPNFEQAVSFLDFKEKIKKLQNFNPNLSKALHYVRKLANEDAKLSGTNQILNEHDSLAEMFNRLTEALGIFFKSSTAEAVMNQKPKFSNISMGSQSSNNAMSVEQYYQNSVASLSGQTYQNFPPQTNTVPPSIQSQYQNFLASNPASNSQNSFAFPTSITPVQLYSGTVNAPQTNGQSYSSNPLQRPTTPNYSSGYSSAFSLSNTEANNIGQSLLSQRYSPNMFGSGLDHEKNQYSNGSQQQFGNGFPSSLSFKPFLGSSGGTNAGLSASLGPLVVAEKVCLNCGAINSHSSAQCRGCGWCGRTNHVVDQCTSKLPRCGYCSKQQNKGLGHKTCDCRYLLSSGKGI